MKLINILHTAEKLIIGERGMVEKVELITNSNGKLQRDCVGNLPYLVTFKTHLGRTVKKLSTKTIEAFGICYDNTKFDDFIYDSFIYKQYKPGDKYP